MTFGNYVDSVPVKASIKINETELQRVEHLGIFFDFRLTWASHIEYIIRKTKYLLFLFNKLKKSVNIFAKKIIYYTFFHSITMELLLGEVLVTRT